MMQHNSNNNPGRNYGWMAAAERYAAAGFKLTEAGPLFMTETERRHLETDRNARLDALRSLITARFMFMDEAERRYASAADIARLAPATA